MCGICGYVGVKNGVPFVINSLENLEYRGYDSCGISYMENNEVFTIKDKGRIAHLKELISNDINSNQVIGHTRWATSGKVNKINSHPHTSFSGRFTLAHNGVIDNYKDIKEKYLNNITFKSETDSEVIASLLDVIVPKHNNNLLDSFDELIDILDGSFALIIVDRDNPGKLYYVKNKTPLLIGKGRDYYSLSSDIVGLGKDILEYMPLEDYQYGEISENNVKTYAKNKINVVFRGIKPKIERKKEQDKIINSHMYSEILEEKFVISKLLNTYVNDLDFTFDKELLLRLKEADTIYLIGCGTSYNASLVGKEYFETISGKRCEVHIASEALYNLRVFAKNPMFIFISQSGETLDVLLTLEMVLSRYSINNIISITNTPYSSIDRKSGFHLYLEVGKEVAVASTKAYVGEVVLFYLLACSLDKKNDIRKMVDELLGMEQEISRIIDDQELFVPLAKKLKKCNEIFFLGRGLGYYLSRESSLKMKEITYLHSEAYPCGELKHGPLSLLSGNTCCLFVIENEENAKKIRSNILECLSRGAYCVIFSISKFSKREDYYTIVNGSERLSIIGFALIGQLLSYFVGIELGNDIDKPRHLAKSVTVE